MKPRERNIGIGALIVGLVVGLVVGAVIDIADLAGTASEDEKETNARASEEAVYYLVNVDVAMEWLAETYPDSADALTTMAEDLILIGQTEESLARQIVDTQDQLDMTLAYLQSALLETEEPVEDREELPEDREITACIALDDDPWATPDPETTDVRVYLQIPPDHKVLEDVIPKTDDWEELPEPKGEFDYGWMILRCDPDVE